MSAAILRKKRVSAVSWKRRRRRQTGTAPTSRSARCSSIRGPPYAYRIPGEHGEYDLYSAGADNAAGGQGENQDIGNW